MKMKLLAASLVMASLPALALAQTAGSTSQGTGTGTANAQGGGVIFSPTYGGSTSTARYAASTAVGDALVASLGTCKGSAAGGVQGMSFGVNLGMTITDDLCDTRSDSTQLFNMGDKAAAYARLCESEDERYAIAVSGGIAYTRYDGVTVHRACPIRKSEWKANGEKLLNPITGQEYTDAELNPPIRVAAAPIQPQVDPAVVRQAQVAQRMLELQAQAPKGFHVAIVAGEPTLWKDGVPLPKLASEPIAQAAVPAPTHVRARNADDIEADVTRIKNTSAIHEANAAVAAAQ
jgi:hypothetical protein